MKIRSSRLTTCGVAADGTAIELQFIDSAGAPVTLELPFDQAESVVMTLPNLLSRALRLHTGDDDARYVFGLREWSLESARDPAWLIATLKTADGFEVSFGIPLEACRSLGWSLQQGADQAVAASGAHEETLAAGSIKLN
jgi:hypothetical protein